MKNTTVLRFVFAVLAAFCTNSHLSAQLQISQMVMPQPQSSYLSDYENNPNAVMLVINNPTTGQYNFRISGYIRSMTSGKTYVRTKDNQTRIFSIAPLQQGLILRAPDFLQRSALEIDRSAEESVIRTNRIPEDLYELCVKLVRADNPTIQLTNPDRCQQFRIMHPQPPRLLTPPDTSRIASPLPQFGWTPTWISGGVQARYAIRIVQIIENQTPRQAIESNVPLVNEQSLTTYFPYPANAQAFNLNAQARYAWQVQSVDEAGNPVGENQGKSEIWTFKTEPQNNGGGGGGGGIGVGNADNGGNQADNLSVIFGRLSWNARSENINQNATFPALPNQDIVLKRQMYVYNMRQDSAVTLAHARTDSNGNFRFEWVNNIRVNYNSRSYEYYLGLENNGHFEPTAAPIDRIYNVLAGNNVNNVAALATPKRYRLNVEILKDADGEHLSGALVTVKRLSSAIMINGEDYISSADRISLNFPTAQIGDNILNYPVQTDRTNQTGIVSFNCFVNLNLFDCYMISVEMPGYETQEFPIGRDLTNAYTHTVRMRLRPGWFAGRVYRADDRTIGINGASVSPVIYGQIGNNAFAEIFDNELTDASGNFTFSPPRTKIVTMNGSQKLVRFTDYTYSNNPNQPNRVDGSFIPTFYFYSARSGFNDTVVTVSGTPSQGAATAVNIQMSQEPMTISGVVVTDDAIIKRQNNTNAPVPISGATVYSPSGGVLVRTGNDGRFSLTVPKTRERDSVLITKAGFLDGKKIFQATINSRNLDTIVIRPIRQNLRVYVRAQGSNAPLTGATIVLEDSVAVGVANASGYADFSDIPSYVRSLRAFANGYAVGELEWIADESGARQTVTVRLSRAGTISGRIKNAQNQWLSGVSVAVEGFEDLLFTNTNNQGQYSIAGVPGGACRIIVRKSGYQTTSASVQVTGGNTTNVPDIVMQALALPITQLFGFSVAIDNIDQSGGTTRITGSLLNIANTPIGSLDDASVLRFENVELDAARLANNAANAYPRNGLFRLVNREIGVNILNIFSAGLRNSGGIRVGAKAANSLVGAFRDSVSVDFGSYIQTPSVNISNPFNFMLRANDRIAGLGDLAGFIPIFTGDGLAGSAARIFKMACTGEQSLEVNGYRFVLDCDQSSIAVNGLTIVGRIELNIQQPRLDAIHISDMRITQNGVQSATADLSPALRVTLWNNWYIELEGATFSEQGFTVRGSGRFTLPNMAGTQNLSFSGLTASLNGLSGGTFSFPNGINVFNIVTLTSGNGDALGMSIGRGFASLFGSGRISLPTVNWDINVPNFSIGTDGAFDLDIPINLSRNFFSMADVNISGISIRTTGNPEIAINGDVDLSIPCLDIRASNFRFGRNSFSMDEFGISFNAAAVTVSATIGYRANPQKIYGAGEISIAGLFSVGAAFTKTRNSWSVDISAGVVIPLTPVTTITELGGGVTYDRGAYTIRLNGTLALAPGTDNAINARMELEIAPGPIIRGEGTLRLFANQLTLARAEIELNYPNRSVIGSVNVGFSKFGISLTGSVDFGIQPRQDRYYIDGEMDCNILGITRMNSRAILAYNYRTRVYISADARDYRTINGVYLSLSNTLFDIDLPFDWWVVSGRLWAYAEYFASLSVRSDLSEAEGVFSAAGGLGLDLEVGFEGYSWDWNPSVEASATFTAGFTRDHAYFSGTMHLSDPINKKFGNCSPGCNSIDFCWDWMPVGGKVCITPSLGIRYNSRNNADGFHVTGTGY